MHNHFSLLVLIIIVTLVFDYMNGVNDSANAIATCVSTRALSLISAVIMAACLNFVGAVISTKVAKTFGTGIVHMESLNQLVILSGLLGAILWSFTTWYFAIPSSSTHALMGGLMGASVANLGLGSLKWSGIKLILLALITSPFLGLFIGFALMVGLSWLVRRIPPEYLNRNFRKAQIVSAALVAFSHGTADAQKSMGIITMALMSYWGITDHFEVPWLVMLACALAISLGTAIGGWRIIKTVGRDFLKMQPIHGFCVQTSTALVVLGASSLGLPTSTTHVLTSSVVGVGLTKRLSAVNWKVAKHIVYAWLFTIPASMSVAFVICAVLLTVHKVFV